MSLDATRELYLDCLIQSIDGLGKEARDELITEWSRAVEEEIRKMVLFGDKHITNTRGAELGALHNETISRWGRSYAFGVDENPPTLQDLLKKVLGQS